MASPILSFINRTFDAIYTQLITAFPQASRKWLLRILAEHFDIQALITNAIGNESSLEHAVTRESVRQLLRLIGYELGEATPAQGTFLFTVKASATASSTYTINKGAKIHTKGTQTALPLIFETDADIIVAQSTTTKTGTATEGETITNEIIGNPDGTVFQKFKLARKKIIIASSSITIGVDTWVEVTKFVGQTPTAKVYRVVINEDETASIQFGNGVSGDDNTAGLIPPLGVDDILITYRVGGGVKGNGVTVDQLGDNIPGDVLSVANSIAPTGGADRELLRDAKGSGPVVATTQDLAVTIEGFEAVAKAYGGISRTNANANFYGPGTVKVQIIPTGGGLPTTTLKDNVKTYVQNRTHLNAIDVRVEDPVFVTVGVTATIFRDSGTVYATISAAITAALTEYLDETNSDWWTWGGDVFTSALTNIIINGTPTNAVSGVDHITLTVPAADVTVDADEIAKLGTISLADGGVV